MSRALPDRDADHGRSTELVAGRPRRSPSHTEVPLGSLTQSQHRHGQVCRQCGSERLTRLVMRLTDGTPVDFVSCHRCESKVWEHEGAVLDVDTVLERTRRIA